ncbi:hypothetical protein HYY69_06205 [Candidatus Woesearchaeota archaeon]|nr:hypothetical protein [Candidatus Woesearchaeota archaeon]
MTMKMLLGLDDVDLDDTEILETIKQAQLQNKTKVVFTRSDGSKIEISLQPIEYFECGILD